MDGRVTSEGPAVFSNPHRATLINWPSVLFFLCLFTTLFIFFFSFFIFCTVFIIYYCLSLCKSMAIMHLCLIKVTIKGEMSVPHLLKNSWKKEGNTWLEKMDNPQDICPFVSVRKRSSIFPARPPEALPPVFLLGPHSPDQTDHFRLVPLQVHPPFCLWALGLPHHQTHPTHPYSMLSVCTGSSPRVNLVPTLIGHAAFLTERSSSTTISSLFARSTTICPSYPGCQTCRSSALCLHQHSHMNLHKPPLPLSSREKPHLFHS